MKIAIDIRMLFNSGIGTVLRELLSQFNDIAASDEFVFLCPEEYNQFIPAGLNKTIIPFNQKLYSAKEQIFYPGNFTADILHYPHYNFPLRYKKTLLVNVHDLAHFNYSSASLHKFYISHFINKLRKRNIQIATGTEFIKRELTEKFKIKPENITVIPHGINTEIFHPADKEQIAAFKKKHNLPGSFILSVGINKPHKNIKLSIEVLTNKKLQDTSLVYCSPDNKSCEELKIYSEDLKVSNRVHILHNIEPKEVSLLYNSASLLLFPSFYEGFGLPPLEAMAAGIPVAASNAEPMTEVLGDAAAYFYPASANHCAEIVYKLLTDNELRNKLINKGKIVSKKYLWKNSAEATLRLYRKIVEQIT